MPHPKKARQSLVRTRASSIRMDGTTHTWGMQRDKRLKQSIAPQTGRQAGRGWWGVAPARRVFRGVFLVPRCLPFTNGALLCSVKQLLRSVWQCDVDRAIFAPGASDSTGGGGCRSQMKTQDKGHQGCSRAAPWLAGIRGSG